MTSLEQRFEDVARRKAEIENQLTDPGIMREPRKYADLTRTHRELTGLIHTFEQRAACERHLLEAREMAGDIDPDMAQLAQSELAEAEANFAAADQALNALLIPRDP